MFGWGRKEKETRQKAEALEYLLEIVHKELSQHITMAADAYDIGWALSQPVYRQDKYMAVLFQFTLDYSETMPAEPDLVRSSFLNFYGRFFPDQRNVQERTLLALRDTNSHDALRATGVVCRKIIAGATPDEREHLMAGLAQIYIGVA